MDGHYVCTEDLRRLGNQIPLPQEPPPLVEGFQMVTPLNAKAWDRQLQELPDRESKGMTEGFHIGFD